MMFNLPVLVHQNFAAAHLKMSTVPVSPKDERRHDTVSSQDSEGERGDPDVILDSENYVRA